MNRFLVFSFLIVLALPGLGQHGKAPVTVTDMLKIKSAAGINVNKQGTRALFTVTSAEPESDNKSEYKYQTQVWITDLDEAAIPRPLTSKENAAQPLFSPDGSHVLFVRTVDGKGQLFLMSLNGGEAIQITKHKYGAANPRFSPDGKQILFTSSVSLKDLLKDSLLNPGREIPSWSMEKPGFAQNQQLLPSVAKPDPDGNLEEIRVYLSNNVAGNKARVITKLNFLDEAGLNEDMSFTHFFIMDAQPESKPVAITRGFHRFFSADFVPGTNQLLVLADMNAELHPDRSQETGIYLMNTDGSGLKLIAAAKGKNFSSAKISPSGKWLAFQYSTVAEVAVPVLAVMPLQGTLADKTDLPFDRNKANLSWSADEKYLYFTAQSNGGQPLYRVQLSTKNTEQLTDHSSGVSSFGLAANRIVFVKTEVSNPFELYISGPNAKDEKQISHLNSAWIQTKKLSIPEKHSFKNEQGMEIEYWVMKPANFEPGKKYPLLLEIHGGPSAMWGPGESSMWHEYQYFCSKGYGVIYANPRGSGGYGQSFLRANIKDWGTGPTRDVLTALDKAIAEGWADTAKLLVTGGSYAGYLVAWIISHDHRFAAACSQRGVYDLATFFGEGNAWRLVPLYFGGYPWDPETKAILQRESPIHYVQQIRTPYIIFHGDNDRRTGFVQSEMLYKSLKALNRPVEYVRHQNATHEITRSGNNRQRIDQMLRTYEFFERWVRTK